MKATSTTLRLQYLALDAFGTMEPSCRIFVVPERDAARCKPRLLFPNKKGQPRVTRLTASLCYFVVLSPAGS
jgi:hypothetical protein